MEKLLAVLLAGFCSQAFAADAPPAPAPDPAETLQSRIESKDVDDMIKRAANSFYSYRPNYIGVSLYNSEGDHRYALKFQLSIKYELVNNSGIFFGYTQKSFWDIQKPSQPFAENNFSPEFFYQVNHEDDSFLAGLLPERVRAVQAGLRHESTGEAGEGSHGWNTMYLEGAFKALRRFTVLPRVWAPIFFVGRHDSAPDNPDVYGYYGYGDLTVKCAFDRQNQLSATFRKGTRSEAYGLEAQLDVHIPLEEVPGFHWAPNPTLFVQLWNGYGEGLKEYDELSTDVVVGFSAIH